VATVRVTTTGGRVVLDATAPPGTTPTVRVRPRLPHDQSAAEAVAGAGVTTSPTGDVDVHVPDPGTARRVPDVLVEIQAPAGTTLMGELGQADLLVRGSVGGVTVGLSTGSVHVDHATGPVACSSSSGSMTLYRVDGPLALRTSRGTIIVRRAGAAVAIVSGGGDVHVWDIRADVTVTTSAGNVRLGRPASMPTRLEVTTTSGRVSLDRPHTAAAPHLVAVTTVSGDVTLEGV
jgi:hypothetical protein